MMNKKHTAVVSVLILIVIALAVVLYNSGGRLQGMHIRAAVLSGDEKAIYDIVSKNGGGSGDQVFEYRVDPSKIKSLTIKQEELKPDGKWESDMEAYHNINEGNSYGRFYVCLNPEYGSKINVAGLSNSTSFAAITDREKEFAKYECFTANLPNAKIIKPNKTQILIVKCYSPKVQFEDTTFDYYYQPRKLLNSYKRIIVMTVIFSDKVH